MAEYKGAVRESELEDAGDGFKLVAELTSSGDAVVSPRPGDCQ